MTCCIQTRHCSTSLNKSTSITCQATSPPTFTPTKMWFRISNRYEVVHPKTVHQMIVPAFQFTSTYQSKNSNLTSQFNIQIISSHIELDVQNFLAHLKFYIQIFFFIYQLHHTEPNLDIQNHKSRTSSMIHCVSQNF